MGIFSTRSNKKFNYTPRFYEGDGNPYEIKHKFDEFRTTVGKTNLKGKFENAVQDYKTADKSVNRRIYIIAGILVLIFLLIIGFDLSIFLPKG
ncbi:MAG: riboflavin synthase subunit beta [Aquaticitalea sp.]